jgi:hypothetical protein
LDENKYPKGVKVSCRPFYRNRVIGDHEFPTSRAMAKPPLQSGIDPRGRDGQGERNETTLSVLRLRVHGKRR